MVGQGAHTLYVKDAPGLSTSLGCLAPIFVAERHLAHRGWLEGRCRERKTPRENQGTHPHGTSGDERRAQSHAPRNRVRGRRRAYPRRWRRTQHPQVTARSGVPGTEGSQEGLSSVPGRHGPGRTKRPARGGAYKVHRQAYMRWRIRIRIPSPTDWSCEYPKSCSGWRACETSSTRASSSFFVCAAPRSLAVM